jgi:hypothetical protein
MTRTSILANRSRGLAFPTKLTAARSDIVLPALRGVKNVKSRAIRDSSVSDARNTISCSVNAQTNLFKQRRFASIKSSRSHLT